MNNSGWERNESLVLHELKRLNNNVEELKNDFNSHKLYTQKEINYIREEVTKLNHLKITLDEVNSWKKGIEQDAIVYKVNELIRKTEYYENVATPEQLKSALLELEEVKKFKASINTIKAFMGAAVALLTGIIGILVYVKDNLFR